jgi:hypothetical protein
MVLVVLEGVVERGLWETDMCETDAWFLSKM